MNALIVLLVGGAVFYAGYRLYARRVDLRIINTNPRRATPARLYNDGEDFYPTDRFVLYGYQFKSIAGAGPVIGAITAGALWGWVPAVLWLFLGVTFVGWVHDYGAMMMSVRSDGQSLTAIAYRLISPTTRVILLLFLFFYLLTLAGSFGSLVPSVLSADPTLALGLAGLVLAGLLAGQMIYVWKTDFVLATVIPLALALFALLLGPVDSVAGTVKALSAAVDALNGNRPAWSYFDPLAGQAIPLKLSFLFWLLLVGVFTYAAAVLPVWRFAQPMNYLGFIIMALAILGGFVGLGVGVLTQPDWLTLNLPAFTQFDVGRGGALQPLWPMLFVTIACGAISGWHSLVSTVGTGRQLEYETDALPVGAGAMFSEMFLGLLALLALAVSGAGAGTGAPGVGAFAAGLARLLSVYGLDPKYGSALALAVFVMMVLTVSQLIVRFMRFVFSEAVGEIWAPARRAHVSTLICGLLVLVVILSGGFVYLWQLFGGANQLMAALALMLVTLWLVSEGKNAVYAFIPMLFMYVTTIAANLVTAWNLWATVAQPNLGKPGREIAVGGAVVLIVIALVLVATALRFGYDGWCAYQRLKARRTPMPAPN